MHGACVNPRCRARSTVFDRMKRVHTDQHRPRASCRRWRRSSTCRRDIGCKRSAQTSPGRCLFRML